MANVRIDNQSPKFYISVGVSGAMYTLRRRYANYSSRHVKNLSTDPDEAFRKAEKVVERCDGVLETSRNDLNGPKLRKIKRVSKAERERIREEKKQERLERYKSEIEQGVIPVGKYAGERFENLPRGYLEWLTDTEFEEDSPMVYVAEKALEYIMVNPLPIPNPSSVVGKVKERRVFDVTVIKATSFQRPSYYRRVSEIVYVTGMVDEEGHYLVCLSTTFKSNVGDELKIKATVKEHKMYGDQAETIVQRISIIE